MFQTEVQGLAFGAKSVFCISIQIGIQSEQFSVLANSSHHNENSSRNFWQYFVDRHFVQNKNGGKRKKFSTLSGIQKHSAKSVCTTQLDFSASLSCVWEKCSGSRENERCLRIITAYFQIRIFLVQTMNSMFKAERKQTFASKTMQMQNAHACRQRELTCSENAQQSNQAGVTAGSRHHRCSEGDKTITNSHSLNVNPVRWSQLFDFFRQKS